MHKLITVFRIPELRTKILFTLLLIAIYRLGFCVPLPFINQNELRAWSQEQFGAGGWGQVMGQLQLLSGADLGQNTIFGLGIMPYISASIIFQLLASVIPQLEALKREGAVGQKKINEYTRYATVLVCIIQATIWMRILQTRELSLGKPIVIEAYTGFFWIMLGVVVMTAGTVFLMWIGEQIDEYGIGNGISIIIMCGIIGRLPEALSVIRYEFWVRAGDQKVLPESGMGVEDIVLLAMLFLGVVLGVTLITQGQRRIPTQSAKHVRGRRVFGGARQYLPLRVNQAGVMPIIFASSLLMFPALIFGALGNWWTSLIGDNWNFFGIMGEQFRNRDFLYLVSEIALIYFFCYFWTAITFNPKDMANNLKDYGSFIPGYRPGKRTADYLEKVMLRITYVGAAFLAVVAIIPTMVSAGIVGTADQGWIVASFFGGTSLLIIISVALDFIQKIDSHLIMRNYDSLLGADSTR